jgi:hypothetical protein
MSHRPPDATPNALACAPYLPPYPYGSSNGNDYDDAGPWVIVNTTPSSVPEIVSVDKAIKIHSLVYAASTPKNKGLAIID